jgi:tRNA(Ile)-lysidine synthase
LWRPLLAESRSVIEEYVNRLGLRWIEDPSNADLSLRRNVVRHEIIPLLDAHFPGESAALARYGDLAGSDDDVLNLLTRAATDNAVDSARRLRVDALDEHPLGMRRRIVRRWLGVATGSREISAERVEAVLRLALSGHGGRTIQMGGGWTVVLAGGLLSASHDRIRSEASA